MMRKHLQYNTMEPFYLRTLGNNSKVILFIFRYHNFVVKCPGVERSYSKYLHNIIVTLSGYEFLFQRIALKYNILCAPIQKLEI